MRRAIFSVGATACLVLVGFGSSLAGGPLLTCEPGRAYLWPDGGRGVPFNPDQGGLGSLDNQQATQAVQEAFDVWGAVASATIDYVNAGTLPVDVDITNFLEFLVPEAPDGLSAIVFDENGEIFDLIFGPGASILGFAGPEWIDSDTCEILEGVSFLNGPNFADAGAALDVMVHEFGHYSNLAHAVVNGEIFIGDSTGPTPDDDTFGLPDTLSVIETMYPFYFGSRSGFSTPELEDIASLSTLYPEKSFLATTGTIRGRILASDGATPLTGINVIARNLDDPFRDAVSAISSDFATEFEPGSAGLGDYTLNGLTPGASYALFVDEILAGGFSTPLPLAFPGPEEFYNGENESNNIDSSDEPLEFVAIVPEAGVPQADIDVIMNRFIPGDNLPVGDDGFVALPLPFPFEICDFTFETIFVNANGNLTFFVGDSDLTESAGDFIGGAPRIAALWDDLNPTRGGLVTFHESDDRFTVIYEDVPQWFNNGSNTFRITLHRSSNHIDIEYGDISITDGLAGVTCGGAINSGQEQPTDIGEMVPHRINLHGQPAVYEVFSSFNLNDLDNTTLRFTGTTDYNDAWSEPNDELREARSILLPFNSAAVRRYTELDLPGDIDFFRFSGKSGQRVIAQTVFGEPDTVLGLFRLRGRGVRQTGELIAADDDSGVGLSARLVADLPADGSYVLAVTSFPDGEFIGVGESFGRYVLETSLFDPTEIQPSTIWAVDPLFGNIVKIATPGGEITGQFEAPEPPSGGPDGLAATASSLYYVNNFGTREIYELDPESGETLGQFRSPRPADGLGFSDDYLFIQDFSTDSIYRLDPVTGESQGRCTTGLGAIGGLAAGDGRLFVTLGFSRVVELDPVTCVALGPEFPVPFDGAAFGLGFDGHYLYVGDGNASLIYVLDPDSGALLDFFSVPFAPSALAP